MKKIYTLFTALWMVTVVLGQRLNITAGSQSYSFPVSEITSSSPAMFSNGTSLTIGSTIIKIRKITSISVTDSSTEFSSLENNTVSVVYSDTTATVDIADNVRDYLSIIQKGAHISIIQSDKLTEEITYKLSGTSTNGEFYMSGSYKATIEMDGLTLTNAIPLFSGAAVHIQNGKRIKVRLVSGTTSTLADATNGSQKGCLYIKGHAEFSQDGTLNVTGNFNHAIKTGEYFTLRDATINVTSAVCDGINCEEYFLMESGTVCIRGTGDDGIQCDVDDTDQGSTGETINHEGEDSGNIYINGGTITVNCTGKDVKGIKCEGNLNIGGGTLDVSCSERKSEGLQSKGMLNITDGFITINANDDAINSAQEMTISGGYIYARSSTNDGIDSNGNCYIKGGLIYAIGASWPEAAIDANETGKQLYILGGTIVAIGGLDRGAILTQPCYSASSWNEKTWYALNVGSDVFAFKTPEGGGCTLVVSGASEPTLESGVTVSDGTSIFGGVGYISATVCDGSSVSLSLLQ